MITNGVRTIYLYLVSFISLMVIVAGTLATINSILDFVYPYESYSRYYPSKEIDYEVMDPENFEIMEEEGINGTEELSREENERREIDRYNAKRQAAKSIATSLALLMITIPVYLFHFKNALKVEVK